MSHTLSKGVLADRNQYDEPPTKKQVQQSLNISADPGLNYQDIAKILDIPWEDFVPQEQSPPIVQSLSNNNTLNTVNVNPANNLAPQSTMPAMMPAMYNCQVTINNYFTAPGPNVQGPK